MSEGFLTRWSRRKQGVEDTSEKPLEPAEPAAETSLPAAPQTIDPETLPSIESIDAETDITAFLQRGVPAHLTRAALRRAWVSDPAIKNFIEMADYDFDFNTPGQIAGFGPISIEEAQAVARAMFASDNGAETTLSIDDRNSDDRNAPEEREMAFVEAESGPEPHDQVAAATPVPVRDLGPGTAIPDETLPIDRREELLFENLEQPQKPAKRGRALPN